MFIFVKDEKYRPFFYGNSFDDGFDKSCSLFFHHTIKRIIPLQMQYRIIFRFVLILFVCGLTNQTTIANNNRKFEVAGRVLDKDSKEAVGFAVISVKDYNIHTVTDINGYFELHAVPRGKFVIQIQCLGYVLLEKELQANQAEVVANYYLQKNSYELLEVNVMANVTKGDKVKIDENAIEYIQPISLDDIMLLLPGSVYQDKNITEFTRNTSRQAGEDANTSLGVGYVADGAPISSDGVRSQMVGVMSNTSGRRLDSEVKARTGINQGVDKRYISTDHIASVEFQRGISSARQGNLSSGVVKISSKKGESPLRVRVKSDLKSTLAYIGKGFKISNKLGTIHTGVDYLNSVNDPREAYDKFSRLSAQAYYKNQLTFGRNKLDIDLKLSETIAVNKMQKDELANLYDETYKGDYSRSSALLKANLALKNPVLQNIELRQSLDYTYDKITRHMLVVNSGPLSTPIAYKQGEHEGIYLPAMYYSDFYIENKPLYLFTQLNLHSRFGVGKSIDLNVDYGFEYKNSKNYGDGAKMGNPLRPPFPSDNAYMRPRPNYEIPAIAVGAAYLQANAIFSINTLNLMKLSFGGRLTRMYNLPSHYRLNERLISEPRLNFSYLNTRLINDKELKMSLRLGYGHENKLPTLDYLYPETIYRDFFVLNAFTNNVNYQHLITHTELYETANPDLVENRNQKMELGGDVQYGNWSFSVTAFHEKTTSGFSYSTYHSPLSYQRYSKRVNDEVLNRRYEKSDYMMELYTAFPKLPRATNNRWVKKEGIEYRMVMPQIKALKTRIEVNGAYYKSQYGSNDPIYYYPNEFIAGVPYPYVGIYDTKSFKEFKRFNSSVWLNTHIPKFRLIFTNFFQLMWVNSNQFFDNRNPYPDRYFGASGSAVIVDNEVRQKIDADNVHLRHLKRFNEPEDYLRDEEPLSVMWNVKVTKEFGDYVKMSFFVDKIIDVNPRYTSNSLQTERNWETPFFGLEMIFSLK